jgi:hypothetical protein
MGKDQDVILAVRNRDVNFLTKLLQKSHRSSSKLSKYHGTIIAIFNYTCLHEVINLVT